jgi:hypothetical protein
MWHGMYSRSIYWFYSPYSRTNAGYPICHGCRLAALQSYFAAGDTDVGFGPKEGSRAGGRVLYRMRLIPYLTLLPVLLINIPP